MTALSTTSVDGLTLPGPFRMIEKLDFLGGDFQKDETGDTNMKKGSIMLGTYVLPMPGGP